MIDVHMCTPVDHAQECRAVTLRNVAIYVSCE